MSCLSGYFTYPEPWTAQRGTNYHSIAESLIRPADHGAVAAIMPTGMTTTGGQHILDASIFEEFFTNDVRIIGDALLKARLTLLANTGDDYQGVSDTFLLFGDPATTLKLPVPRRPQGLTANHTEDGEILLTWQAAEDCNGDPVAGYNVYRRSESESDFAKLNPELLENLAFIDMTYVPSTLYYYAVASVDDDSDESVKSVAITPSGPSSSDDTPAAFSACFVDTVSTSDSQQHMSFIILLVMVLLPAIVWLLSLISCIRKI